MNVLNCSAAPGTLTTQPETDDDDESSAEHEDDRGVNAVDKSKLQVNTFLGITSIYLVPDFKSLSNLNEIDKSEHKASIEGGKGYGWPTDRSGARSGMFSSALLLFELILIPYDNVGSPSCRLQSTASGVLVTIFYTTYKTYAGFKL